MLMRCFVRVPLDGWLLILVELMLIYESCSCSDTLSILLIFSVVFVFFVVLVQEQFIVNDMLCRMFVV